MRIWLNLRIGVLTIFVIPGAMLSPLSSQVMQQSKASNLEREYQEALTARDRGDVEKAEAILTRLHSRHPGIFAVDETLGAILASRGDYSAALPLFEAAARENPSSDVAHANLGAALYNLHRNQEALTEFRRAVRINPSNGAVQQSLASLYIEVHQPKDAARALSAALRLDPQNADLKLDTIDVLLAAGQLDEARKLLSTVTNLDSSARAQVLQGELDEQSKDYQNAARHFSRAIDLEPSEENVWHFGYDLLSHWMFSSAVIEFRAASAKFPESKRMKLGLGAALYGAAKHEEAIHVFADLLKSEPDNAVYAGLLGISCNAMMQNISPRCAELAGYALAHPKDAKAATYAASSILSRDDGQQDMKLAGKLLGNAIAADPAYDEAQLQMGVLLQQEMDWKGSIPYLERALKSRPENPRGHYRLARAYLKTGRKAEGLAELELQKKYARQANDERDKKYREVALLALEVQPE